MMRRTLMQVFQAFNRTLATTGRNSLSMSRVHLPIKTGQ